MVNPRFVGAYLLLGLITFFINPYRACRKWAQKQREPLIHIYGETPLFLFDRLARSAGMTAGDTFVELGAGRGKLAFWAAECFGCKARAIEWVPSFVRCGRLIARLLGSRVHFEQRSLFDVDLTNATVVYLYAIHLSEERMRQLALQCEKMPPGAIVISIGEAIPSSLFAVEQVLPARFAWGETGAYLQRSLRTLGADQAKCDVLS